MPNNRPVARFTNKRFATDGQKRTNEIPNNMNFKKVVDRFNKIKNTMTSMNNK